MVLVTLVPARRPPGFFALRMMRHHERAVFDISQDRRSRRDVHVAPDFYRRDELRIASDHAVVADLRHMLVIAVVVHSNDTTSDVGLAPDYRVAKIAQMARLAALADPRLLGLHEIAD